MLAATFTYKVSVVLQTRKQLRSIVEQAPVLRQNLGRRARP